MSKNNFFCTKNYLTVIFVSFIFFVSFANLSFADTWDSSGTNTIQRWDLIIDLETGKIIEVDTGSDSQSGADSPDGVSTTNNTWINAITNSGSTNLSSWTDSVANWNSAVVENTWKVSVDSNRKPDLAQDELSNAVNRMYSNGLTKYSDVSWYMPNDLLTREQTAKFIAQAYSVLGYQDTWSNNNCNFADLSDTDPSLQSFISQSCKLWILNGRENKFHYSENLTKAQFLTILMRIFQWSKSDETMTPRWKSYILKAQVIWLTKYNDWDDSKFEIPITRWEVALLIYRFKSIVENESTYKISLQQIQNTVNESNVKIDSGLLENSLGMLTQWISAGDDPELREAIFWMYKQKMTEYSDPENFRAFDQIQRQEASKFIWQFHQAFIKVGNVNTDFKSECYYKDLSNAEPQLKSYILYDCSEWIFDSGNGYFYPTTSMKKSEFVASLIRMFGKTYTATGDEVRWKPYFDVGLQLGLVTYMDRVNFDKPITRYEVAVILYRFRVKYQMLYSLNTNTVENQIISMMSNSEQIINGVKQWNVYINTTKLNDQNFSIWYIELFDSKYKIVKRNIEKYFSNNFVWYGDVYDINTDQAIGTLNLLVSNNTILEWNIRPYSSWGMYYDISKPTDTSSYYIIKQIEETK